MSQGGASYSGSQGVSGSAAASGKDLKEQLLEQKLGLRGEPMGVDTAISGSNPNYDPNVSDDDPYHTNCQRCVWAYEMRRRGYDVEALPRTESPNDPAYNGRWKTFMYNAKTVSTPSEAAVEKQMAEWGPGSRAILSVTWDAAHGGGGHVVIAERKKVGGIEFTRYIDPQGNGTRPTRRNYLGDFASMIDVSRTELIRIDNLNPNPTKISTYLRPTKKK